jgi:hypothetical protein
MLNYLKGAKASPSYAAMHLRLAIAGLLSNEFCGKVIEIDYGKVADSTIPKYGAFFWPNSVPILSNCSWHRDS